MKKISIFLFLLVNTFTNYGMQQPFQLYTEHPFESNNPLAENFADYWLPIAAFQGDMKKFKELLPRIKNIDAFHSYGRAESSFRLNPLTAATLSGNIQMVQLLLKKGANVNAADALFYVTTHISHIKNITKEYNLHPFPSFISGSLNKFTLPLPALFIAAAGGYNDIVELLLENGAEQSVIYIGGGGIEESLNFMKYLSAPYKPGKQKITAPVQPLEYQLVKQPKQKEKKTQQKPYKREPQYQPYKEKTITRPSALLDLLQQLRATLENLLTKFVY